MTEILYAVPSKHASRKRTDDWEAAEEILQEAQYCTMGLWAGTHPYVTPMNFVHRKKTLFFHSSWQGKKMEFLRKVDVICINICLYDGVIENKVPCFQTSAYRSLTLFGNPRLVEDDGRKMEILQAILDKYTPGGGYRPLKENDLLGVALFAVDLTEWSVKISKASNENLEGGCPAGEDESRT
jgi:nitroimidazol reductase NimA-like FMN-containing flavoprotein (pyridoxamine 5'-phosphate oxidase superfamily)